MNGIRTKPFRNPHLLIGSNFIRDELTSMRFFFIDVLPIKINF